PLRLRSCSSSWPTRGSMAWARTTLRSPARSLLAVKMPFASVESGDALSGPTVAATAARLRTPAATSFFIYLRPVGPSVRRSAAEEFSKYTQKATEFGQNVLKKERRPRGRLSHLPSEEGITCRRRRER